MQKYLTPVQIEMLNRHALITQSDHAVAVVARAFIAVIVVLAVTALVAHIWECRQLNTARHDDELEWETVQEVEAQNDAQWARVFGTRR